MSRLYNKKEIRRLKWAKRYFPVGSLVLWKSFDLTPLPALVLDHKIHNFPSGMQLRIIIIVI